MIPLMDDVPHLRFPWVNYALILLNALFFYRELTLPPGALDQFIDTYAFVPARLSAALGGGVVKGTEDVALTIFTAMFLHEGWLHFLGNMLFLWIFGDNVEDALGASGAIAGVLGFYLILYPGARVLSLVPIVIFSGLSACRRQSSCSFGSPSRRSAVSRPSDNKLGVGWRTGRISEDSWPGLASGCFSAP